ASARLSHLLEEKNIHVTSEFSTSEVNSERSTLLSYDGRRLDYDLLVTVPTHSGAEFVDRSGIGDELAFIPTDRHTLAAKHLPNVFIVGDAADLPSSKAGSAAHFQAEGLVENLLCAVEG